MTETHMSVPSLLVFLFLLLYGCGLDDFTCNEAQSIVSDTSHCLSVTWLVGRLVDHANTTGDEYGPMVLPISEQENRVVVWVFFDESCTGIVQLVFSGRVSVFLLQAVSYGFRMCRDVSSVSLCISVYGVTVPLHSRYDVLDGL